MSDRKAFAVWITGLPASGKSSITREVIDLLNSEGVRPAVLESDSLRVVLTPAPTYEQEERDRFYRQLAEIGNLLVGQGIPVIFDATANLRAYRDHARRRINRFMEVYIKCPVEICIERDPKGIYAAALQGTVRRVPGLDEIYEQALVPDIVLDCKEPPAVNADRVVARLRQLRYI